MKHQIARILNFNIVADETMAKLIRIMCIIVSLFVLSLSLWKLVRLDLSEAQLFLGVLLAPITPMLLLILGLVLPGAIAPKSAKRMPN